MKLKINKNFIYFVFLVLICLLIFGVQQFRINNINQDLNKKITENSNQKMFIL